MFSIEWLPRVEGVQGRTGQVYKTFGNGGKTRICSVTTWAMGSCAIATLQQWGGYCRLQVPEIQPFFDYLCDKIDHDWEPQEFYFMLSSSQLKGDFKYMIQNPNVRLRDKFRNKSHGPNTVSLYRYSKAIDFKRIVNRGKAKT